MLNMTAAAQKERVEELTPEQRIPQLDARVGLYLREQHALDNDARHATPQLRRQAEQEDKDAAMALQTLDKVAPLTDQERFLEQKRDPRGWNALAHGQEIMEQAREALARVGIHGRQAARLLDGRRPLRAQRS